jgi:hypothetical protein
MNGDIVTYLAQYMGVNTRQHPDGSSRISSDHLKQEVLGALDTSKYAFGEDLLEFKKTLASLREIMHQLAHKIETLTYVINQLRRDGKSFAKAISQTWLKARYEIRPLVISAENLLEILHQGVHQRRYDRVARSVTIEEKTFKSYDLEGVFHYHLLAETTQRGIVGCGLYIRNESPRVTVSEKLGLGYKDVLPVIWAVTRFSFLVDRFIDVSSMIYGLENLLDYRLKFLGGWVTKSITTTTRWYIAIDPNDDWTTSTDYEPAILTTEDKNRQRWSPSVQDILPTLEFPDWETWVDILAIFRGAKANMRL